MRLEFNKNKIIIFLNLKIVILLCVIKKKLFLYKSQVENYNTKEKRKYFVINVNISF